MSVTDAFVSLEFRFPSNIVFRKINNMVEEVSSACYIEDISGISSANLALRIVEIQSLFK